MDRSELKVGQRVYFGRRHGEKTLGEIVKLNPTKAKIKTLEDRGSRRDYPPGTLWTVPYSMIQPALDANTIKTNFNPPTPKPTLQYNPFCEDNDLLLALLGVYASLSPENLSCDGEAPLSFIRKRRTELERKRKGIVAALGYDPDETQLYQWDRQRSEYHKRPAANQY